MIKLNGTLEELQQYFEVNKIYLEKIPFDAHKKNRPVLIGIGGELFNGGALKLAAEAALRAGAGYFTLLQEEVSAAAFNLEDCGEWLISRRPLTVQDWQLHSPLSGILFGVGYPAQSSAESFDKSWTAFFEFLNSGHCPENFVVDGGGQLVFLEWLRLAKINLQNKKVIWTPHPKEAERLLELCGVYKTSGDRIELFQALKNELSKWTPHGALLLKGADPIFSSLSSNSEATVFPLHAPKLATMGSGDVFAGFALTILCRIKSADDLVSDRAKAALYFALWIQAQAAKNLPMGALASEIGIEMRRVLNQFQSH